MNSIERMNRVLAGQATDRRPFVPSVYEHGAAVLGKSPGEVSRDPALMARAAIEAHALYDHDIVTVGIDIYNIEAEAFGCQVSDGAGTSVPGVTSHPLAGRPLGEAESLAIPVPGESNRLGLIAEAAGKVFDEIGGQVWVYACTGGPFSQAVELRGFENLIGDMMDAPEAVHKLMARTTELSLAHARDLSQRGCGIYLYESWATLPLIDPSIFERFVVPWNRKVISAVRREFDTPPPAIIMGGDTAILIDFFLQAGTSLVAPDFNTDFDYVKARTKGRKIIVRGCVDPKMIERGQWDPLAEAIGTLGRKARGMKNFVWGCGCVSYNTPPEHVLRFKQMCQAAELAEMNADERG